MSLFNKLKKAFVPKDEPVKFPEEIELEKLEERKRQQQSVQAHVTDEKHHVDQNIEQETEGVIEPPEEVVFAQDEFDNDSGLMSLEEFEQWESEQIGAKFKQGLEKSREQFQGALNNLMSQYRTVDEDFFEALEEMLIQADVGFQTVMDLTDELRDYARKENITETIYLKEIIVEKIVEIYNQDETLDEEMNITAGELNVILMVGVNGVGKTTTIGKLAHRYKAQGKTVMLAAGDTFRAGAIDQLQVWGDRVGVEVVRQAEGSDPAAVMYDAVHAAKKQGVDVLICDTAGRLQNKKNLMNELGKIKRVLQKVIPEAPHEVLLALDATTGQNALSQAKSFKEVTDVTGIVLTKLDGTAKGGIVLAIRNELSIPVKYVGLGEKLDDLQPFNAERYVYGLFADMIEASNDDMDKG